MTIPAAPREPRWLPCLARRWLVGLAGFLLVDVALALWFALTYTSSVAVSEDLVVGALLGPGLLLLGFWFRGALRLRVLLREGTLTNVESFQIRPVLGLNPAHLRLRYRLRDAAGQSHDSSQFVRAGSPLGRLLLEKPAALHVIHDPWEPGFSRAVAPGDFLSLSTAA